MVSAWASGQRLVLGQEATEDKSNEITAIPLPLQRLELKGALVTIDAMGCQTKIAATILDRGADYLLAVKDNQPTLHDDIKRYFDDAPASEVQTFEITDGDHGRIEVRRHVVSHRVDWLAEDSRFPGIKSIAMVESTVERNGETSCGRRYYICSLALLAVLFAGAVRSHWHIENRLHWVLDVIFHEDLSRLRTGNGPHNMATVRHMVMNLLRSAKPGKSLKVRRKLAGWDPDYLQAILQGIFCVRGSAGIRKFRLLAGYWPGRRPTQLSAHPPRLAGSREDTAAQAAASGSLARRSPTCQTVPDDAPRVDPGR